MRAWKSNIRRRNAMGIVVAAAVASWPATAAEPPSVLVVFDGSGSMWGQLEGDRRNKLTLARDAVRSGLAKMTPGARVGVMSYGHRRGGDCGDVELAVRPETGMQERIAGFLDKLNPRGRGPITNALKEAAKSFGGAPGPRSIVLIHDDADNCQLDPCSALADLEREGPGIAVHVVSLGVRREDVRGLSCFQARTGGSHFIVATPAQAGPAIEEALRLAAARAETPPSSVAVPVPEPKQAVRQPVSPPPQGRTGVQLAAALADGMDPHPQPARWRIARRGETGSIWEGDGASLFVELPAGAYEIEAWLGFVQSKGSVEVVEGKPQTLKVVLGAGLLTLPAPAPQSTPVIVAAARDAIVALKRVDAGAEMLAFQRGLVPEIALVPGNYIVEMTIGASRLRRVVGVRAGQTSPLDETLALGGVELTAIQAGSQTAVENALVSLYEDDPDAPQGRREVWRSAASPATAVLPVGTYYAVAQKGDAEARERIVVRAGEIERRAIALEIARLGLTLRLAGGRLEPKEPVSHRIERLDAAGDVHVASRMSASFLVPAGRYRIESRAGEGNAITVRDVDLKGGAREQIAIDLPAGALRLKMVDQSGVAVSDVAWDIRDATGRPAWSGNVTEASPLLMAGRYVIKADARDRHAERIVEVRAGEQRSIDLPAQ